MADGVRRDEWQRTSLLAALIHNQWRKKHQMRDPRHFNPFETSGRGHGRLTPRTIHRLKAFLPDHGG